MLSAVTGLGGGVLGCSAAPRLYSAADGVQAAPPHSRRVGIAYSLWHYPPAFGSFWNNVWGEPTLGHYVSDDRSVIRRHITWLTDAGVDFILIDCSNDLRADLRTGEGLPYQCFEEHALCVLMEELANAGGALSASIMIGNPTAPEALFDGALDRKADEIFTTFVRNDAFRSVILYHYGKPLLVVFGSTPATYQKTLPPWSDSRFTVRFMTSFISQQPALLGADRWSKLGYWSWEDRGIPTYTIFNGQREAMNVVASSRASREERISAQGRRGGQTFLENWSVARVRGPSIVLAGTFNEWKLGEQPSAEISKDIEPSREYGTTYLDLLRDQARLFKQGL